MTENGGMVEHTDGSGSYVIPIDEYQKTIEAEKEAKKREAKKREPVIAPVPGVFKWLTPENRLRMYSVLGVIGAGLLAADKVTDNQWDSILQIADQIWILLAVGSQFLASVHVKPRPTTTNP